MFHTVVLEPSGRRFEVRQGESLLEAGLRAGVMLRYGCSNGTCGDCRARLLDGKTESVGYHDFCFTAADAAQGYTLLCCNTALSDLRVAATELGNADDIPEQQVVAKVSKVETRGSDYRILHLRTPRSRTLQFLAGQEVLVQPDAVAARRLPLANCPCDGLRPQLHVRRIAGDPFSDWAFGPLAPAVACELRGPVGDFVLREQPERPLLFIAYETGFAPIYSLLEHVLALDWQAPLRLFWLVDAPEGLYLENYCRALQDALDDFQFHTAALGEAGQFGAHLRRLLERDPQIAAYDVYAVPPPGDAEATRRTLVEAGVAPGRIKLAELEAC